MTREEAIGYLKRADTTVGKKTKTRTAEALEMAIKALEQEPCEELDFVQPHKKVSVNLEVCKMREATVTEREGIEKYIDSIAEPCEDYISRQALHDIHEDIAKAFQLGLAFGFGEKHDEMDKVIDEIKKVVTQEPKTGHWIKISPAGIYECSECGQNVMTSDICAYKFCHWCSARMFEPQERSDKK